MNVAISKGGGGAPTRVDVSALSIERPDSKALFRYNDLLGRIMAERGDDKDYLVSPTLSRQELDTNFFEKTVLLRELLSRIEAAPGDIELTSVDPVVGEGIARYLRIKHPEWRVSVPGLVRRNLLGWIRFGTRVCLAAGLEIALAIVARLLFPALRSQHYDYVFWSTYDYRSDAKGEYRDAYYNPLIEQLKGSNVRFAVFLYLTHNNSFRVLTRYLKSLVGYRLPYELQIYNRIVSPIDAVAVAWCGIRKRLQLPREVILDGLDIKPLLQVALREDLQLCRWFINFMQYRFARRLLSKCHVQQLTIPFENQAWEKLVVLARNEVSPRTRVIGFQHTSFSFKLIQYFPSRHESSLPIYPNKILTAGEILTEVLTEYGNYPAGVLATGCALRHASLFSQSGEVKAAARKPKRRALVYAFSVDDKNYRRILDTLVNVCGNKDYQVYLRIHPLVPLERAIHRPLPSNIVVANHIPWPELFQKVSILCYDDNSVCIDGLVHNVDVVYFGLAEFAYDTNRLFKHEHNQWAVHSEADFARFLADYFASDDADTGVEEYNRSYIKRYFAPPTEQNMSSFLMA